MQIHWPNSSFMLSVADSRQFPEVVLPQVAVAGHSNVGKSSLLNAIFNRKDLVKASKRPGCTRLLNLFNVDEQLVIIDLPGYGFARAAKSEKNKWARLIEEYLTSDIVAQLVLVLLDIRHGPKDSDLQLIEWLNERDIRWIPIATKADKLIGNDRSKRLSEMKDALGGRLPMTTSCLDKRGIDKVRSLIIEEIETQLWHASLARPGDAG